MRGLRRERKWASVMEPVPSLDEVEARLRKATGYGTTHTMTKAVSEALTLLSAARPLLEALYDADAECPLLGQPAQRKLAALLGKPTDSPGGGEIPRLEALR